MTPDASYDPRMADILPTSPQEITPAWLSSRVGGTVTNVAVEPVTNRTGVNGEMARLHLQGPGVPRTVMAKFPAVTPGARGVAAYQHWYEREVRFYLELATATPLRTPQAYSAELDTDGGFVLLLEDLGGLRQGSQVAGCSIEDARNALQSVAGLHARWWEPQPVPHPWLPFTTVGLDRARPVQGAFARAWSMVREAFPRAAQRALDAGVEAYPELLAEIATGPVTICHGDYRLDNMFFEDTGDTTEIAAFDWQFACRARGAYDVAYFLALDLDPTELARERDTLLTSYVTALAARGIQGYAIEDCRRDYATSLILSTAVFAIGAAALQASEATRVTHEVGLQRLGLAVADAVESGLL